MILSANPESFKAFAAVWTNLYLAYGRSVTDDLIRIAARNFVGQDSDAIWQAVQEFQRDNETLPQNPIPVILRLMRQKNGVTEEQALKVYRKLLHCARFDVVFSDRRAAYAVSKVFGTVNALGMRPDNDYCNTKDQKDFISAYLDAKPQDLVNAPEVIQGSNDKQSPLVRFIGDYFECKKIAEVFYSNLGIKPRLYDDPPLKTSKALPSKPAINPNDTIGIDEVIETLRGLSAAFSVNSKKGKFDDVYKKITAYTAKEA